MILSGVLPPNSPMAPMDVGNYKPWEELSDEERGQWARRMEVYAAQIDHMDQQVGQLLKELDALGISRNTLVMFLSDNGGAAEDPNRSSPDAVIGTRDSYRGYARPWASVSNTPWRRHKVTCYEGGISTPLLVRWPEGIPPQLQGTFVRSIGHVIDLMPTFAELASVSLPLKPGQLPPEGHSLLPELLGQPDQAQRIYFWEHEGNRGVREGKWKLVMLNDEPGGWKLYDMETDRVESHDLSREKPDVFKHLQGLYVAWADRVGVIPWTKLKQLARQHATTQPAP